MDRPAGTNVGVVNAPGLTDALAIAVLWVGFAYAAWTDWRLREVEDRVWVVMALAGAVLGVARVWPSSPSGGPTEGALTVILWVVVAGLALEHFVPWDEPLAHLYEWLPGVVEIFLYLAVGGLLGWAVLHTGDLAGFVVPIVAYVGIVLARALFELRLLYGGADAKALMVAGIVLPLCAVPVLTVPANAVTILGSYPFALTLLMDAAVCAAVIPVALAFRNLRSGDFEFPRGFTSFRLDVVDLPRRFVWVRDPTFDESADEAETSEDDRRLRERQRDELLAQGVTKVWVTPQLPFVILLAAGAVVGVLLGNLVFDVAALL